MGDVVLDSLNIADGLITDAVADRLDCTVSDGVWLTEGDGSLVLDIVNMLLIDGALEIEVVTEGLLLEVVLAVSVIVA